MKTLLMIAVACLLSGTVAEARPHPATAQPGGFIDMAAKPAYPIEVTAPARRHRVVHRERPRHEERARAESHRGGHKRAVDAVRTHRPPKAEVEAKASPKAAPELPVVTVQAKAGTGLVGDIDAGFANPAALPILVGRRPERIEGVLRIADAVFQFASGGSGWSMPYGDYELASDSDGDWGRRHGALDIIGSDRGEIKDRQLGRMREGVEMHAMMRSGNTEGCVGIDGWHRAKQMILAMIGESNRAVLHFWPGTFSVTPDRTINRVVVWVHEPVEAEDRPRRRHLAEHRHRERRRYAGA